MTSERANPSPINGIDFIIYLAKDVERAILFYRETLGLTLTQTFSPEFSEFTLADGTTFALDKEGWLNTNVVSFGVSDIRAAVDLYKKRGVAFLADGEILESPVCFFAFAKDSEGNTFQLHQRK